MMVSVSVSVSVSVPVSVSAPVPAPVLVPVRVAVYVPVPIPAAIPIPILIPIPNQHSALRLWLVESRETHFASAARPRRCQLPSRSRNSLFHPASAKAPSRFRRHRRTKLSGHTGSPNPSQSAAGLAVWIGDKIVAIRRKENGAAPRRLDSANFAAKPIPWWLFLILWRFVVLLARYCLGTKFLSGNGLSIKRLYGYIWIFVPALYWYVNRKRVPSVSLQNSKVVRGSFPQPWRSIPCHL